MESNGKVNYTNSSSESIIDYQLSGTIKLNIVESPISSLTWHPHHDCSLEMQVSHVKIFQNSVEMTHMIIEPFFALLSAHLAQFLGQTVQSSGQVATVDRVGRDDVAEKEVEVRDAQDAEECGRKDGEKDDFLVYALAERQPNTGRIERVQRAQVNDSGHQIRARSHLELFQKVQRVLFLHVKLLHIILHLHLEQKRKEIDEGAIVLAVYKKDKQVPDANIDQEQQQID